MDELLLSAVLDDGTTLFKTGEYTIQTSYFTPTDAFSFELVNPDPSKLRKLLLQNVELFLNGKKQLVGRIEKTTRSEPESVSVAGRDFIADLTECSIDPSFTVKAGDTLGAIIKRAAGPCGVLKVVSGDGYEFAKTRSGVDTPSDKPPKDFLPITAEDLKPGEESVFEFLNRLLARHGATLQPTETRGTVAIAAPHYFGTTTTYLRRKLDGTGNLSASSAVEDFSSFPTYTLGRGKLARAGSTGASTAARVDAYEHREKYQVDGTGIFEVLDRGITTGRIKPPEVNDSGKLYRLKVFRDDKSRTGEQLGAATARVFAERFKETLVYTCTVTDFTPGIPAVDTMVWVDDDVCDLHEQLWVAAVTHRYAKGSAQTADLTCYRPGSLQLDYKLVAGEPPAAKRRRKEVVNS